MHAAAAVKNSSNATIRKMFASSGLTPYSMPRINVEAAIPPAVLRKNCIHEEILIRQAFSALGVTSCLLPNALDQAASLALPSATGILG